MKLLIVESPAKAKKISEFLGQSWRVEACRGHVRDLPESKLGIDTLHHFAPSYEILAGKGNLVKRLIKFMREADEVYLGTDPDREAIAWHLQHLANTPKPVYRVTFNSITEAVVNQALVEPRAIHTDLVEAQVARRIVDRLVGYLVSPLATKALQQRLSAGRVQSVALRLVVERDHEIAHFQARDYWRIHAVLSAGSTEFVAQLHQVQAADPKFKNAEQAQKLVNLLQTAQFWVHKVEQSVQLTAPQPPFNTASLQQVASKKLGLAPDKTMDIAQLLYEQGFITYHRTDSVTLDPQVQAQTRDWIETHYGKAYVPVIAHTFANKSSVAQEAHETIRPTDITRLPQAGESLYELIWQRFIASQMSAARYTQTVALIHAGKSPDKPFPVLFKTHGRVLAFEGFLKVYQDPEDEDNGEADELVPVPTLRDGELLTCVSVPCEALQTRPPAHFTESSLLHQLETLGIGRPSTFASILKTIKDKGYVDLKRCRLLATTTGQQLNDYLVTHFPQVFAVGYTARLEASLDEIACGKLSRPQLLERFWTGFQPQLRLATESQLQPSTPVVLHPVKE
jgi:DNA topoisomerase I